MGHEKYVLNGLPLAIVGSAQNQSSTNGRSLLTNYKYQCPINLQTNLKNLCNQLNRDDCMSLSLA